MQHDNASHAAARIGREAIRAVKVGKHNLQPAKELYFM
jgi:hypothetical protein